MNETRLFEILIFCTFVFTAAFTTFLLRISVMLESYHGGCGCGRGEEGVWIMKELSRFPCLSFACISSRQTIMLSFIVHYSISIR